MVKGCRIVRDYGILCSEDGRLEDTLGLVLSETVGEGSTTENPNTDTSSGGPGVC
jgi:hypothetical protein